MPYVNANGKKIVDYRGLRGLTQEMVALRAGYSKRTIERVENGGRTQFSTIENIAEVLDVDPRELLLDPEDDAPAIVTVELDDQFFSSPEEAQQQLLREILKIVRQAGVIRVKKGSIIVTLDMTRKDARLLQKAFAQGRLAHIGVRSVSFESPPSEWDEPTSWAETADPAHVLQRCSDAVASGEGVSLQLRGQLDVVFDRLVRQLRRPLLQRVQRRMGSAFRARVDAEDVVQSAFARLFRIVMSGQLRLHSPVQIPGLMVRITDTCLADGIRQHMARQRSLASEAEVPSIESIPATTPPDPAEAAEVGELLSQALMSLPMPLQAVMRLWMEGWTSGEIAEQLLVPRRVVYHRIYRARAILRRFLEEHGVDEP